VPLNCRTRARERTDILQTAFSLGSSLLRDWR
jgi:hypothetical protein